MHDSHVFLYKGRPIPDMRPGLLLVCEDVGKGNGLNEEDGFVLHNLCHCFNAYMRIGDGAESVIMRMPGHSSREMFSHYRSDCQQDMKNAVNQMRTFLAGVDRIVDQTAN